MRGEQLRETTTTTRWAGLTPPTPPGTIQVKGKHAIRKMRTPQLVLNGADGDPLRTVAGALFPQ
jgi:hypothetical protein